ncbi:MAG TPA: phosphoglycerate mutase family protein [Steroidobacteraceae bacterium]|nr:phosphoglycerate mutase family protein [Steroidobacteraceae bacterium]
MMRSSSRDCRRDVMMGGMEAPGITRHRRPFLAPLYLSVLVAMLAVAIGWVFYNHATTTVVFLVRPAGTPAVIDDPPVSPEGEARAERLARMFGEDRSGAGQLDAIYRSDDRRAEQTAAPLSARLQRAPTTFAVADARVTADRALHEHAGATVFIVASGAALPQMVHELTGITLTAAPDEADFIYVVSVPSIGRAHLSRLRL